jgi:hypothetical protein
MNQKDEDELNGLLSSLSEINKETNLTEEQRKALKKAALALSVSFIHGHRKEIEDIYNRLDEELTEDQKRHLQSLGLTNNKIE